MRMVMTTNCDGLKTREENSTDIKAKGIIATETYENGVDKHK